MLRLTSSCSLAAIACCVSVSIGPRAVAQNEPTAPAPVPAPVPAPALAPTDPPPSDPAPTPPPQPPPEATPAPTYAPAPQQPVPPNTYEGQVSPEGSSDSGYSEPVSDAEDNDNARGDDGAKPFELPPFAVQIDPFIWLLEGRLPLQLEVGVWNMISVELVPEFVTSEDPPLRDFSSYKDGSTQHSNGLGPISGTSLGVGFWLDGKPFDGYVIRAIFTNYGYEYSSRDSAGTIDKVTRTTRRLGALIGSSRRWSFFTLGGGIGLSYELHQQERCDLRAQSTSDGTRITSDPGASCDGARQLALDRSARNVDDVNGFLYPVYLDARFTLGFIID